MPARKSFKINPKEIYLHKGMKRLWFVICFIGMVVQNLLVTVEYFKYVTTTEVLMELENEFTPPAFSICALTGDLINHKAFPVGHSCHQEFDTFKNDPAAFMNCTRSYQSYPVSEIMNRLTFNLSDTIDQLQMGNQMFGGKAVKQLDDYVGEFYFDYKRCIRIKYNPDPDFKIKNSDISRISNLRLTYLSVDGKAKYSKFTENYVFHYYTDPKTYPRGFRHRPHSDFGWKKSSRLFGYQKYQFVYLPAPYFSKCTESYGNKEIETRDHCIEKCMKQQIRRDLGPNAAAQQLTLTPDEWTSNPELKLHSDFSYVSSSNRIIKYYDECFERCPIGCHVDFYEAELINSGKPLSSNSYKYMFINMSFRTKMTFTAKLDLLSFIIYIASVCSLWFGFAIYDTVLKLLRPFIKNENHVHFNNRHVIINRIQTGVTGY